MTITLEQAAELLRGRDDILILAHRKPDGDTLGSCFALLFALEAMGKTARVECADGYPSRYSFLYGEYTPRQFTPRFIVACDVAERALLGTLEPLYPTVHLCIDHHKSNTLFAEHTLLDAEAAATTMLIGKLIELLGVAPDQRIADSLYTGLTTDTGCFRYANVGAEAHRCAARLIEMGARHYMINKLMFASLSRGRIEVQKLMMQSLEFSHGDRCVVISLPGDIHERFAVSEEELDGISAFPRTIQGVMCGVTIRMEKDDPTAFRISLRCEPPLDASRICTLFGGGGHAGAAGCTLHGTPDEVQARMLEAVGTELAAAGIK